MSDLYNVLAHLCEQKGVSAYRMCKDVGIQPSIMTDLKKGRRSSMKAETIAKIAAYFEVSVESILGFEQKEIPADKGSEDMDIAVELEEMMQKLESDGSLMFDGNPASPEAIRSIKTALEMGLRYARDIEKGKSK